MPKTVKLQFAAEISKPNEEINLARAALLISKGLNPLADVDASLAKLDIMVATVRQIAGQNATQSATLDALNYYLFDIEQFTGNRAEYYRPQNSFLDVALVIKMGLPITLSVLYLELGWRLGLPVDGIGLPGHFLVAYNFDDERVYVDPFHGGKFLTESDCMDLAQVPEDDRIPFRQEYLTPVTKRAILFRMLMNLKQSYLAEKNWPPAHLVVDWALLLRPKETQLLRDRGLLAYRLEQLQDAVFDIQQYLLKNADAADANWLENYLFTIQEKLLHLN